MYIHKSKKDFLRPPELNFYRGQNIYQFDNVVSTFIKNNIPFVIRNFIPEELPSKWQNLNYLASKVGGVTIPLESYENFFYEMDKLQTIFLSFQEYVDYLKAPIKTQKLYLAEVELFNRNNTKVLFQILNNDIKYHTVYTNKLYARVMFLGHHSITQMHYHTQLEAMINQVVGIKKFFLFPPNHNLFYQMNPYPWYHAKSNWSQYKFKVSNASDFKGIAERLNLVNGVEVSLSPGDSLYIPIYWWHIVFGEEMSLSFTDFFDTNSSKKYLSPIGLRSLNHIPNSIRYPIKNSFSKLSTLLRN